MKNIGNKIKSLIQAKNVSLAELERIAGLKNSAIRNIINGSSKNPTIETLSKICKALDCSLYDLVADLPQLKQPFIGSVATYIPEHINDSWNAGLFIESTEAIEKYLRQHKINITFDKAISLIKEVYLYSLQKNDGNLDEKFAEWIIEKIPTNKHYNF